MFLFEYAAGEKFRTIISHHRNLSLQDGGATVQFFGHKMYGGAGLAVSGLYGAPMGVQARIFRQ